MKDGYSRTGFLIRPPNPSKMLYWETCALVAGASFITAYCSSLAWIFAMKSLSSACNHALHVCFAESTSKSGWLIKPLQECGV